MVRTRSLHQREGVSSRDSESELESEPSRVAAGRGAELPMAHAHVHVVIVGPCPPRLLAELEGTKAYDTAAYKQLDSALGAHFTCRQVPKLEGARDKRPNLAIYAGEQLVHAHAHAPYS